MQEEVDVDFTGIGTNVAQGVSPYRHPRLSPVPDRAAIGADMRPLWLVVFGKQQPCVQSAACQRPDVGSGKRHPPHGGRQIHPPAYPHDAQRALVCGPHPVLSRTPKPACGEYNIPPAVESSVKIPGRKGPDTGQLQKLPSPSVCGAAQPQAMREAQAVQRCQAKLSRAFWIWEMSHPVAAPHDGRLRA
jgi:hypothetical protein